MEYPKTPILNKVKAIREKSQAIGEFVEWLSSYKKIELCQYMPYDGSFGSEGYHQTHKPIEDLLADFFEIDASELEKERREVLAYLRVSNGEDEKEVREELMI